MPKVADPRLADKGRLAYEWARKHMPILVKSIERLERDRPLHGIRAGFCLHVTKETSVLVMGARMLGADVGLCAANPLTTQDDVAAFLASQGIDVYAWRNESMDEYYSCIRSVLSSRPATLTDDGSDMHVLYHREFKGVYTPIGGTEETTTGVTRLRALARDGILAYPIIAVNDAYTKHLFDNRYGTGQSTIDGILRATSMLLAGKTMVVAGYGWVGKGIASRARGMGAKVVVTEVDPIRALEAHMDGFAVMPMDEACRYADVIVTATGQINVVRGEHIRAMKDGVVLANAGHFDVEIDVRWLERNARGKRLVRENLEEYMVDGRSIYLIARGRIANLVAAEGHPPEVMALSFANQLLSIVYLVRNHASMERKVYGVPGEIDRQVALNALDAMGIRIDEPTEEQVAYAGRWM
ncbi:MAG: adenosylhomocysteinase [Candidatus Nitrosocaldus sp.]|nr:adenosylhomocysteinase [Candidatus Nitrosocaldus sp.]